MANPIDARIAELRVTVRMETSAETYGAAYFDAARRDAARAELDDLVQYRRGFKSQEELGPAALAVVLERERDLSRCDACSRVLDPGEEQFCTHCLERLTDGERKGLSL